MLVIPLTNLATIHFYRDYRFSVHQEQNKVITTTEDTNHYLPQGYDGRHA